MLVEYLAPEGFITSTAATGIEGLEQLGGSQVDLVILDVMLPQLSGFEVLRRIRAMISRFYPAEVASLFANLEVSPEADVSLVARIFPSGAAKTRVG